MILLLVMVLLFLLGIPIGYAIGIAAITQILLDPGFSLIWSAKIVIEAMASYPLLAVPFFILAAEFMNTSTITNRIFKFANLLIGYWKGGLALVNVLASIIFSGMSGSAVADSSGLGKIEIKAMKEEGYESSFSAVVTAASATIGPIIPPSIPLVIYGFLAEESIGRLLLAGAIPGIILGLALMLLIMILARLRGYPSRPKPSFGHLWVAFKETILPLLTPVIIIFGILAGIFTPTEAAVVASVYAFILSVIVYRDLGVKDVWNVFIRSGITSAKILFITAMATLLSFVITTQLIPQKAAFFVFSISKEPWVILILINIFLIVVGCFMEALSAMVILIPILLPMIVSIGVDPIHFGVIIVLNLMIGLITPPYGLSMFIVCDIAKINVRSFLKEALPFYLILFIVLMLVTFVPILSMWVPNLMLK